MHFVLIVGSLSLDFRMPLLSFSKEGAGNVPAPIRFRLEHFSMIFAKHSVLLTWELYFRAFAYDVC